MTDHYVIGVYIFSLYKVQVMERVANQDDRATQQNLYLSFDLPKIFHLIVGARLFVLEIGYRFLRRLCRLVYLISKLSSLLYYVGL